MNTRWVALGLSLGLGYATLSDAAEATGAAAAPPTFRKIVVSDKFYSEGAAFADFNGDGVMDVVSGPFWYAGPDFKTKHEIYKPTGKHDEGSYKADGEYSDNFIAYAPDLNLDGRPDYLVYGFPGKEARAYINPGPAGGAWKLVNVFDSVDNESPQFADLDGDGKPEGIFHSANTLGYAVIDWTDPLKKWTYKPISPRGGWQRFTHGYGFGDVNGDGKADILESKSWWEQPADGRGLWKRHPYDFYAKNGRGQSFGDGGAQMFVYDVDGDGLNDVVTSLQAHGCGLAWFKQVRGADGAIDFRRHDIMPVEYEPNAQGIKFSQLHAMELVDINGDGLKDIVTGKRFYAHHSTGDIGPTDPAMLYWFELRRNPDKTVTWIGHKVDDDSGVGTQVTVGDLNGDKTPDIVVGNKKGTFVFLSEKK